MKTFLNSTAGTAIRAFLAVLLAAALILIATEAQLPNAHWYTLGLLAMVAVFQIAISAGLPLGEFTQGGQMAGRLDYEGRKKALASLPLLVLFGFASLHLGKVIQLPTLISQVLTYSFMAYLGIGLIMNSISRSLKESIIWTPVLLLNIYLVAILYFSN